ncbi:golgin-45 [Cylas formicarius]|uniref:golgin-45 n=1 Tax=Cylas formicarius TaxID=197179 RepID=UPI002958948B|nr:golgin-45 [Cylas formicarius]
MELSPDTPIRTVGDGMESKQETPDLKKVLSQITTPSISVLNSMKPVIPQSKMVPLIPKYAPKDRKLLTSVVTKPKEAKFIPYEPYKAAVEPIKPVKIKKKVSFNSSGVVNTNSKNNIEIQELVDQMVEMRSFEMNSARLAALTDDQIIPKRQWEKEKESYETDIKNLKETISHLENQLKFQAQVNSELKTLLVAAVGEDLETRVQHLTEDKLSLARALLNSANHLTTHQEQTEWLSGQCEVWRSKFLASSLMVEELAKWKAALTKRTNDLQNVMKKMLNESSKIQKSMLSTFANMNSIETNQGRISLKSADVVELATRNLELSERLREFLNAPGGDINSKKYEGLNMHTPLEQVALKIIKNPVSISSPQDSLCSALLDVANSMSGEQKYLQVPLMHPCCSHCRGDVQDV